MATIHHARHLRQGPAADRPACPYILSDKPVEVGVSQFADGRKKCYNNGSEIGPPKPGQPFSGQDAQFQAHPASYTLSADGLTVCDNITGLTWQRSPDTDGDGALTRCDKLTLNQAQPQPAKLNAAKFGGFDDWRLPSVKELQSIVDYTRSPHTSQSPAIDPIFNCPQIINETNQADYPWYWSGTTHAQYNGSGPEGA